MDGEGNAPDAQSLPQRVAEPESSSLNVILDAVMDEGGNADPIIDNVPASDLQDGNSSDSSHHEPPAGHNQPVSTPPPPSTGPDSDIQRRVPDWVDITEDTSRPDETELTMIETSPDAEVSGADTAYWEEKFYTPTGDPDRRPVKRLRLSWNIKHVRGTRRRPNMTRIMHSPAAHVDGKYWHIKFYPRGNNTSSVSTYVECSEKAPRQDQMLAEGTFTYVEGSPDSPLREEDAKIVEITTENVEYVANQSRKPQAPSPLPENATATEDQWMETEQELADEKDKQPQLDVDQQPDHDWRIPAQVGVVIYNPAEPRVYVDSKTEHQFNKNQQDWGWNYVTGPWETLHKRQHGHRAPLLQHDTLTLSAYITLFNDPSQALWWHPSKGNDLETQWPSVALAGLRSHGTKDLYHSPGVAGLTLLLLLAPFRKLVQDFDINTAWHDPDECNFPLFLRLQQVLYLMRKQSLSESFVDINPVLEHLLQKGESWTDVLSFWEVLHRGMKLEAGDEAVNTQLASIFSPVGTFMEGTRCFNEITLHLKGLASVQEAVIKTFGNKPALSPPAFLPIRMNREHFDDNKREWKLSSGHVHINDQLVLPKCAQWSKVFTLYSLRFCCPCRRALLWQVLLSRETKWTRR